MVDMVLQDPFVISNIFDDIYFNALQKYAMNLWANDDGSAFSEGFGRYQWANTEILNEGSELLLPMAKEKFKSNTLKPSWNLLVTYQTEKAKLWKHKELSFINFVFIDYLQLGFNQSRSLAFSSCGRRNSIWLENNF